jgi:hypothetical protein
MRCAMQLKQLLEQTSESRSPLTRAAGQTSRLPSVAVPPGHTTLTQAAPWLRYPRVMHLYRAFSGGLGACAHRCNRAARMRPGR